VRRNRILSWSGGKDAAYVLAGAPEVTTLLITYDGGTSCLPHTAVPVELARAQARAAGRELVEVAVPDPWDGERYGQRMRAALESVEAGAVLFGDLFLADLRASREQALATAGIDAAFPGWTTDTQARARRILALGISAVVVSVDLAVLPAAVLGRPYDERFLAELPPGVDPCGENGEFQTFVLDSPLFDRPLTPVSGAVRIEHGHALLGLS
jgi:uncharacterized protein (TIGR00290 family)